MYINLYLLEYIMHKYGNRLAWEKNSDYSLNPELYNVHVYSGGI